MEVDIKLFDAKAMTQAKFHQTSADGNFGLALGKGVFPTVVLKFNFSMQLTMSPEWHSRLANLEISLQISSRSKVISFG